MKRVESLFELKRLHPTTDLVYVKSIKKFYRHQDGGWIEKRYFSALEMCAILKVNRLALQHMVNNLGIRRRKRGENMGYDDLLILTRTLKLRRQSSHMTYKEIKSRLGI